jgi:acyl carrier protein
MNLSEKIRAAVNNAVDQLNAVQASGQAVDKSPRTVLVGDQAVVDSLGFVNLIVALEQQLEEEVGIPIPLTENPDLMEEGGPCSTLGKLTEYLTTVAEQQNMNG